MTPQFSALAWLQRAGVLGALVLLALGLWWAGDRPALTVAVLLLGLTGHAWVLALEFGLAAWHNRRDPAPAAGFSVLLRAWWVESHVAAWVFGWLQPFAWRRWPDTALSGSVATGSRAVVLVHGFVCNRGLWTPWLRELQRRGVPCATVNLEPVFGSIDDYVPLIDAAVARATAATGQPPLLVGHSMGGLAIRAWLRGCARAPGENVLQRVHHIVTLGTPHHGTWLARFSHLTNGAQMRVESDWLKQLAADESPAHHARFTCWYSSADNIVFPASTATLPGADNRHITGVPHVALAFHPKVMADTLKLL